MNIEFEALRIVVLRQKYGPDKICFHTNLPDAMPNLAKNTAIFEIDIESGKAEEWLLKAFNLLPEKDFEIINI